MQRMKYTGLLLSLVLALSVIGGAGAAADEIPADTVPEGTGFVNVLPEGGNGSPAGSIQGASGNGGSLLGISSLGEPPPGAPPEGEPPPGDRPPRQGEETDEAAPVFTSQPSAAHYVIEASGFSAPTYSVEVSLPEGSAAEGITLQWYLKGSEYGAPVVSEGSTAYSSITVEELAGAACGVYPVCCKATCVTDGAEHTAISYTTAFIVCKGVLENSVLTFSDVHEDWDSIGQAIADTIANEGGLVPALVVATGDYNNSYVAGYNEEFINKCITEMIDRISLQLGGIDTVWVSGNHDNGYATGFTNANKRADLGLDEENYYDLAGGISGTGIIYDSRRRGSASSSLSNDGLIVIGVNYEDLGSMGAYEGSSNGRPADPSLLTYGDGSFPGNTVYAHLDTALQGIARDYEGELILISTHAGLHALGVDPDSAAAGAREWSGGCDYSIACSAAVVRLVNSYAHRYGMNIMWLFGHDHSKGENEFYKLPGDSMVSATDPVLQLSEEQTIAFSYAHSGYITKNINGHMVYSLIKYDDTSVTRTARVADGRGTPAEAVTGRDGSILFPEGLDFTQQLNKPTAQPEIPPSAVTGLIADGSSHELVNPGTARGGEIVYALGTDGANAPDDSAFSGEIPTASEPGVYYVWYRAAGDDSHGTSKPEVITVVIGQAHTEPSAPVQGVPAGDSRAAVTVEKASQQYKTFNAKVKGDTLTWDSIDGADSFVIYARKGDRGLFKRIGSSTEKRYSLDSLENGCIYTFIVRYEKGGELAKVRESARVTARVYYKPAVKAEVSDNSVVLRWKAVPGAEKYRVYRYEEGRLIKIADTEKACVRVRGNAGSSFAVRAYAGGKWTVIKKSDIATA
ncbi:MAG: metallophosphoesterase [Oscillospiraceae bacterium]|nr:metallophosphoesterase [Oscillospiraceae bacterium]